MTMTSNNPSINISVATKYLDPGERGAQVIIKVMMMNMMTMYDYLPSSFCPVVSDQVLTHLTIDNNIKTKHSINISVATKYLDPGERGAQVINHASDMVLLDVIIDINLDQNIIIQY